MEHLATASSSAPAPFASYPTMASPSSSSETPPPSRPSAASTSYKKRKHGSAASPTTASSSSKTTTATAGAMKPIKKRLPSCDLCRARKVKCVKAPGAERCEGCVVLDQDCAYTHERRKPGPANSFARKHNASRSDGLPRPNTSNGSAAHRFPPHAAYPPQHPPAPAAVPRSPPLHHPPQPFHARSYSHGAISSPRPSLYPYHPSHPDAHEPQFPFLPHFVQDPMPPAAHEAMINPYPPLPLPPGVHPLYSPTLSLSLSSAHSPTLLPFQHSHPASSHHHDHLAAPQHPADPSLDLDLQGLDDAPPGDHGLLDPLDPLASFLPLSPSVLNHPDSPFGRWVLSGTGDPAVPGSTTSLEYIELPWTSEAVLPSTGATDHIRLPSVPGRTTASGGPASTMDSDGGVPGDTRSRRPTLVVKRERRVERVEEVVEWQVVMRILGGYHTHLYPLMPIVHWPTFSQALIARQDEGDDEFRAFLLSLVAYSILQLPRSALAFLPVPTLRKLHLRCHAASQALQNRRWKEVSVLDVATLYCDHIYLGTLGRTVTANVVLAEAIRLAQTMSLHDERKQEGNVNVVDQEVRRRVFWLLYGSDRTISALTSSPLHIVDSDLHLPLPLATDDNLLTPSGAFPQPPHAPTPLLAGFHHVSRLYRLLGEVLTALRAAEGYQEKNAALADLGLPTWSEKCQRPAREFMEGLDTILERLPEPLMLVHPTARDPENDHMSLPATSTKAKVGAAKMGTGTGRGNEGAYATCRANLLVSQAMVRFAIRLYARVIGQELDESGWGVMGREHGSAVRGGDVGTIGEAGGAMDGVERDVLGLLEAMSPESLAANGESLRCKVLFVASGLLERWPSTAEGHNYVSDFLAVYTRIAEEHAAALLEVEDSSGVTRDGTPA